MERRIFLKSTGAAGLGGLLGGGSPAISELLGFGGTARAATLPSRGFGESKPLQTASNDLSPFTGTWTDTELRHLLRRAMFGVPQSQFDEAKTIGGMKKVVAKLLDAADLTKNPLPAKFAPYLDEYLIATRGDAVDASNKQKQDRMRSQQVRNWWLDQMLQEHLSIRQKMTLLWTNHVVTATDAVRPPGYVYTYLMTCMKYALGNFKQLILDISIDPAMLVYLNGNQSFVRNGKSFANENYARELMELFTLGLTDPHTGQPNYTETDIQNSARALTGWTPTTTAPFVGQFDPTRHDSTNKTFLGQTGNFTLDDIIDIIFEQGTPAGYNVAYFVSQKLYQEFVYYVPNPSVVDAMATALVAANFEIAPVMELLLSSAHFYDANVMGAQLKSPAEYMGSLIREFGFTYEPFDPSDLPITKTDANGNNTYGNPNITLSFLTETIMADSQGQDLLNPPNVKGWPGGHNWISTGTYSTRESFSTSLISNIYSNTKQGIKVVFDPMSYALTIQNATTLSAADLAEALEHESLAFDMGPNEGGDLNTDLHGPYPEPHYQFNTPGVNTFAKYLAVLPEFQLY